MAEVLSHQSGDADEMDEEEKFNPNKIVLILEPPDAFKRYKNVLQTVDELQEDQPPEKRARLRPEYGETFDEATVAWLDRDHLSHIFSFLTPTERQVASKVCHRWKTVYNSYWNPGRCIKSATFFRPDCDEYHDDPEDDRLSTACDHFDRLLQLGKATIRRVEVNYSDFLDVLLNNRDFCANLEELQLHYVDAFPSGLFIHKVFPNLQVLELHNCERSLTEERIGTAIRNLKKLHTFISHSSNYKGFFFRRGLPATLKTLVFRMNSINSVSYLLEGLEKSADCKLEHVTIGFHVCPWTWKHGDSMYRVCELIAPNLITFKTSGEIDYDTPSHNAQNPAYYALFNELPLRLIRPCVEGFSLMTNLTRLKLYDNKFSAHQMKILYRNCNKIEKLEVTDIQSVEKIRAMSQLSNLKALSAVCTICDESLDIVAQSFPKLRYFFCKNYNLRSDIVFDIDAFERFLVKCEYLENIQLTDTYKFGSKLKTLEKEVKKKRSTHIPVNVIINSWYNPYTVSEILVDPLFENS